MLWYFFIMFTFISNQLIAHNDKALSQRDNILLQLELKMELFRACVRCGEHARNINANFSQPGVMSAELVKEIAELKTRFEQITGLVTRKNLWQVYLASDELLNSKNRTCCSSLIDKSEIPKKTLMSIAEEMVSNSIADEGHAKFRLATLLRDEAATKFRNLLSASFSLHIVLGRALKRAQINKYSFINCLEEELRIGYWQDKSFSAAMNYLKEYLRYEILVIQSNKELMKERPGIATNDANSLAEQYIANYLFLDLIAPFLISNEVKASHVKQFAGADNIAINYDEADQPTFAISAPQWYRITKHILNDAQKETDNSSSDAEIILVQDPFTPRRRGTMQSITICNENDQKIDQLTKSFNNVKHMLNKESIRVILEEFIKAAEQVPSILKSGTKLMKQYVDAMIHLPMQATPIDLGFMALSKQFNKLQELIRSSQHWHSESHDGIFDKPFDGDMSQYLQKFSDGDWQKKLIIFQGLVELLATEKDERLHTAVKDLADIFALYVKHLDESEIILLLKALADLNRFKSFWYVQNYLSKLERFSEFPTQVRAFREDLALKIPPMKDLSNDVRNRYKKEVPFYFLDENNAQKKIMLNFPIDSGFGTVAKNIRDAGFFAGASNDLLMLVARFAKLINLEKDEILYKEGAAANSFALLLKGEIEISVKDGATKKPINALGPGNIVGEFALFKNNAFRTATVRAVTPAALYAISNLAFQEFLKTEPKLMKFLLGNMAQKVAAGRWKLVELGILDIAKENSPFAEINNIETMKLTTLFKKEKKNQNLEIKENKKLYFIDEGSLLLGGNKGHSESLVAGKYVNDINFIAQKGDFPFTIKFCDQKVCKLRYLTLKKFEELADKEPNLLLTMATTLSKMIQDNDKRLKNPRAYTLQLACENGDLEKAKFAVSSGIDVDAACPVPYQKDLASESRPLHVAVFYDQINIVNYLLDQKADTNVINTNFETPIDIAKRDKRTRMIEILNMRK